VKRGTEVAEHHLARRGTEVARRSSRQWCVEAVVSYSNEDTMICHLPGSTMI